MHLIDKAEAKILLDGINAATNANIFAASGFASTLKRNGSAFGHEVKGRSSFHDQRRARGGSAQTRGRDT